MDMPGSLSSGNSSESSFFGNNITMSLKNGSIEAARLDDMCRRVMTPYFHLKQQMQYPPIDGSSVALNNGDRK